MDTSEAYSNSPSHPGRWWRITLTSLAVAGLLVGGILSILSGPQGGEAVPWASQLCGSGQTFDCHHVLHSRYAKVGPVSAAQLGMAYFFILSCWFGFVGIPNRAGRRWHAIPTALVIAGSLVSLWFIYVMSVRLPVWCTWCMATHGLNAALFILTLLAWRAAGKAVAPGAPPYPSWKHVAAVCAGTGGVLTILVLGTFALFTLIKARRCEAAYLDATNNASYVVAKFMDATPVDIPVRPDDVMIGLAAAPNTLVGFFDFECPHCRQFYLSAGQIVKWYPERLRVIFKHYPLGKACNAALKPDDLEHPFACESAWAFEAGRQIATPDQMQQFTRKLFDLQDVLYSNGPTFADRPYQALAVEAGLDADRLASLMQQGAGHERIEEDVALARQIGIKGSGELFLNGKRLPNWHLVKVDPGARPGFDTQATQILWARLLAGGVESGGPSPAHAE